MKARQVSNQLEIATHHTKKRFIQRFYFPFPSKSSLYAIQRTNVEKQSSDIEICLQETLMVEGGANLAIEWSTSFSQSSCSIHFEIPQYVLCSHSSPFLTNSLWCLRALFGRTWPIKSTRKSTFYNFLELKWDNFLATVKERFFFALGPALESFWGPKILSVSPILSQPPGAQNRLIAVFLIIIIIAEVVDDDGIDKNAKIWERIKNFELRFSVSDIFQRRKCKPCCRQQIVAKHG